MQTLTWEKEILQVVLDNRCPFCGSAHLIDRGIGYATGEMLINWKYQCANYTCKQQFYIQRDLTKY